MSESEIIKTECEAIRKFCRGDRQLALQIIQEFGSDMRRYFQKQYPKKVTSEELFTLITAAVSRSQRLPK